MSSGRPAPYAPHKCAGHTHPAASRRTHLCEGGRASSTSSTSTSGRLDQLAVCGGMVGWLRGRLVQAAAAVAASVVVVA